MYNKISVLVFFGLILLSTTVSATTTITDTYIDSPTVNGTNIYENLVDVWSVIGDVPTNTPTSGDTANLSKSGEIYNWVTGLNYKTLTEIVASIGNWTADKASYYLKTEIDTQGEMETIWGVTLSTDTERTTGLAAQDECSEITGCIEGAYNAEVNLTSRLDDNYVDVTGDIMTGPLDMGGNNVLNVTNYTGDKINVTCCVYLGTIQSTDGNSIAVQPTGDEDDYFSFKTPAHRPTIKREGGKFIYFESSNIYDVGISFREDATYSGTLNYEKDEHAMTLLGKNSPVKVKTNSEYVNYFLFETTNHIPQLSAYNASYLKIADNLSVDGYIKSSDWSNVTITESQVSDADWWDADGDITADEISESKINFVTSCSAGDYYRLNGNDLECTTPTDTDSNLTEEDVTDFAGGMWTGNTETLITVTFQDDDNTIDAVVESDLNKYDFSNIVDANITDTLTASNLIAAGNIDIGAHNFQALSFTSDVATGTAPLVVTSTTQVANLNVSYAGTAYDLTCTDCVDDTELAYNTGQHLTTTSNPTHNNMTITDCIIFNSGGKICDLV